MRALAILTALTVSIAQAQTSATRSQSGPVISVGREYQVSKPFSKLAHYENLAAGDTDNPGRLMACSTVAHEDLASQGNHCYVSFDYGKTWSTAMEFDKGPRNSDPTMIYGRGDTVIYVNEYIPGGDQNRMEIFRSPDGGKTWEAGAVFPFIDRQGVAVDETNGRFAGRIYVTGVSKGFGGPPASVVMYRSMDGGTTFVGPVERPTVDGPGLLGASNTVIFSDGTVAFTTFAFKKGRSAYAFDEGDMYRNNNGNAELKLLTSTDGGESYNPWITVSDVYMDLTHNQGGMYAQIAVDPGSRFFKDRLYAVWPDIASGRIDIRFAYSADKGKTWSAPITVNDDRPPVERRRGPDHMLPVIGVNKAGALLIAWYDRRDFADNMGWKIRAAASLDGGVTFSPSAPVSSVANVFTDRTHWVLGTPGASGGGSRRGGATPTGRSISVNYGINGFFLSGGHTSGIAVGADDLFYPVWSDNRTGISQLWTAAVTVNGTVHKHGASELAALDDITHKVAWENRSTKYDRATNTLTITARLRNTSKDVIRAPMKVRVVNLTSQMGAPAIVGSTNGISRVGAIWDFNGVVPAGGLMPDSATAPRTLTVRLSDVRPIRLARQGSGFTSGLVRFDARVYSRETSGAP